MCWEKAAVKTITQDSSMAVNKIRESTQAGGDYCWTTLSAGRLGWFVQAGRRQQAEAGRINLPLLPILAPHSTAGSERVWPSCLEVGGQVRCYRRYLSLSLCLSLRNLVASLRPWESSRSHRFGSSMFAYRSMGGRHRLRAGEMGVGPWKTCGSRF